MKKYFIFCLLIITLSSNSQTFNGSTGPITDNNCDSTHDFPIIISGIGTLGLPIVLSEIKFDITHTYDGDLKIYLLSPNGIIVELSTSNGSSGDNYTNTIISQFATVPITSGSAPFTGTYTPEGDLSVLNGINADGTWILRVCDAAGSDVGTLNSCSLSFISMADVTPDNVNIESPYAATINQSGSTTVYGQIYKAGLTDLTSVQTSGIQAWIGYSTTISNPNTWTNWIPATYNQKVGNNDEYKAIIGPTLPQGTFYYVMRYRINTGYYYYGGTNNGFWDGINHNSGVLTVNPPVTPVNDNCIGAISLTVNPDYLNGTVTPGTVMAATASPVDGNSCAGSEDDDVWFSFVATLNSHRISLLNVSGSTTDLFHSLWTGNCNSLSLVSGSCSDPDISNPLGLVVGQTYYLRVNTVTPNPSQTTVFNVSIGSPPTPPTYVSLQSPSIINISPGNNITVIGRISKTGFTDIISGQTPGIQAWIGYSSTNSNPNTWTNWMVANFNQKIGSADEYKADFGSTLAPGTYYFATRFQFTGGDYYYGGINSNNIGDFWDGITFQNGVLTISLPPVPVNDECSGAISLTIGNVFNDFALTGSTFGATDITPVSTNCDGTPMNVNSSVFYSVVVPPSGSVSIEIRPFSNVSLTDTVMLVSVGDCNSLIGMACNDNFTGSLSRLNMFGQSPGSTLYITVYKKGTIAPTVTENQFKISAYTATTMSTDSFDNLNFSYFPNPVNDFLNLSYNHVISNVEIFNLLGQKIISKIINTNETKINMSNLTKGIYLVNVISNSQIKTLKVIKE